MQTQAQERKKRWHILRPPTSMERACQKRIWEHHKYLSQLQQANSSDILECNWIQNCGLYSIWQAGTLILTGYLSVFICGNLVITNRNVVQTWQFVNTIEYNQPTQNTPHCTSRTQCIQKYLFWYLKKNMLLLQWTSFESFNKNLRNFNFQLSLFFGF